MLNNEQIARIDEEITRLENRKQDEIPEDAKTYIDGRIDALKWAKESL